MDRYFFLQSVLVIHEITSLFHECFVSSQLVSDRVILFWYGHQCTFILRSNDQMIQWFHIFTYDQVIQWFNIPMIQWSNVPITRWFNDWVIWYSNDSMSRKWSNLMVQWSTITMIKGSNIQRIQYFDGQMIWQPNDQVIR